MPVLPGIFSPAHLAVITIVALLVLGPEKLPELARTASRLHREYRKFLGALDESVQGLADAVPDELTSAAPSSTAPRHEPGSPPPVNRDARTWPPDTISLPFDPGSGTGFTNAS